MREDGLLRIVRSAKVLLHRIHILLYGRLTLLGRIVLGRVFLLPVGIRYLYMPLPGYLVLVGFLEEMGDKMGYLHPSTNVGGPPDGHAVKVVVAPAVAYRHDETVPHLSGKLQHLGVHLRVVFGEHIQPGVLSLVRTLRPISGNDALAGAVFVHFGITAVKRIDRIDPCKRIAGSRGHELDGTVAELQVIPKHLLHVAPHIPGSNKSLYSAIGNGLQYLVAIIVVTFHRTRIYALPKCQVTKKLQARIEHAGVSYLFSRLLGEIILISPWTHLHSVDVYIGNIRQVIWRQDSGTLLHFVLGCPRRFAEYVRGLHQQGDTA